MDQGELCNKTRGTMVNLMKIHMKLDENIHGIGGNSVKISMEYGELDENSHEYLMKILTKLDEILME